MKKDKPVVALSIGDNTMQYGGTCSLCGHKNSAYDWDNSIKSGAFGEMYCRYCGHRTPHTNVKKEG